MTGSWTLWWQLDLRPPVVGQGHHWQSTENDVTVLAVLSQLASLALMWRIHQQHKEPQWQSTQHPC